MAEHPLTRHENGLTLQPCPRHDHYEADGSCNCRLPSNQRPLTQARNIHALTYTVVQAARKINRGCQCDGEDRCSNCDHVLQLKAAIEQLDKERQCRSLLQLLRAGRNMFARAMWKQMEAKTKLQNEVKQWKKKYSATLTAVEKLHDILTRKEK